MTRKTTAYARQRGINRLPPGMVMTTDALKGDSLSAYRLHNTLFTQAEREKLLAEPRAAVLAARQGRATYNDLAALNSMVHKGTAIEDARIIIRGFAHFYAAANEALAKIDARATSSGQWRAPTLYASEINALDDLFFAYDQALRVCTFKEFYDRQELAISRAQGRGDPVGVSGVEMEYPES